MSCPDTFQTPGCLPQGFDLDSMLTPEQFCIWQNRKMRWFSTRRYLLPGVINESREHCRIHPRTYLEKRLKPNT